MSAESNGPRLNWDWGTGYDLFTSLLVLHHPDRFNLPGAWAAGVRSRLPAAEREVLEQAQRFMPLPLHWLYTLPAPKDGAAALWALGQVPPGQRLRTLALTPLTPPAAQAVLERVAERQAWDKDDQEALRAAYSARDPHARPRSLPTELDWWAQPAEALGERLLAALRAYHHNFFAEEEQHLAPALQAALARAQEEAAARSVPDLIERLSQGVRSDELLAAAELVLAPSYWGTPFLWYTPLDAERLLVLFGARPAEASLVPGEVVPDALLASLKALADPTRLRILLYLSTEPHTPAQLARRLRLRAPTVTHHLNALRLAGLVQLTLAAGGERRYAARPEAARQALEGLEAFLSSGRGA